MSFQEQGIDWDRLSKEQKAEKCAAARAYSELWEAKRNGPAKQSPPKQDEPPPQVETLTADALMRMKLPDPRWAVDGIVPEGLSILAGKPKLGKSWLALHLALAVSSGGVALGRIRVDCGDVLYLALEDTKRRLQSRIRRLLGPGEHPSGRLHLAREWPRLHNGGAEAIAAWIESHPDARLIIIDTWAKFRPIRTGKSDGYEVDYADGAAIKTLADKYGIAVIVVHHCRKLSASDAVEEVSGSVGLTGACDGILVMRRERGQLDASLTITGRDVDEAELALSFDKSHCLWQLMGEAEECRLSKERAEVLNILRRERRPLKPSELAPLINKSTNAAKLLLWKMANDGFLEALGGGMYAVAREEKPQKPGNHGNHGNHGNRHEDGRVSDAENEGNRDEQQETPWG